MSDRSRIWLAALFVGVGVALTAASLRGCQAHASELRFTTNPHANAMKTVWNSVQHDWVWVSDGCKVDTLRAVAIYAVRVYRRGPGETTYRQIALLHPATPTISEAWRLNFAYSDTGSVYCVQEAKWGTTTMRSCPSNSITLAAQ